MNIHSFSLASETSGKLIFHYGRLAMQRRATLSKSERQIARER